MQLSTYTLRSKLGYFFNSLLVSNNVRFAPKATIRGMSPN